MPSILDEAKAVLAQQRRQSIIDEAKAVLGSKKPPRRYTAIKPEERGLAPVRSPNAEGDDMQQSPTMLDEIANLGASVARGGVESVGSRLRAPQALMPVHPAYMTKLRALDLLGRSMSGGARELLPGDPRQANDVGDKIGEVVGGSLPSAAEYSVGGPAAMSVGAGLANAGAIYDEAIASGATEAEAKFAARVGFGIGAITNLIPGGEVSAIKALRNLKKLSGGLADKAKQIVGRLTEASSREAIQEGLEEGANQELAGATFDQKRTEEQKSANVATAMKYAAASGGLMTGTGMTFNALRAQQIVIDHPEKAAEIAAKDVPSRKDFQGLVRADEALSKSERVEIADEIRSQMRPIPVAPASEQGPLTLAENANEEVVQGQSQGDAQGQEISETPEAAQGAAVLESGPTAQAEPGKPGQPSFDDGIMIHVSPQSRLREINKGWFGKLNSLDQWKTIIPSREGARFDAKKSAVQHQADSSIYVTHESLLPEGYRQTDIELEGGFADQTRGGQPRDTFSVGTVPLVAGKHYLEFPANTPKEAIREAIMKLVARETVPANTGQPKRSIYNHAAIERKMDALVREHGGMIAGDDFSGPQDPDAMGGEEGASVRSHWVFRDTPQGKAAAKELRNQLPPEWKRLAMNITTSKTGKAEDIRYNIGDQAMIDGLIRWHQRNSPTTSRNKVAEFIDKYQKMFPPHQVYIAKQWLAMRDMPKGEKVKLETEPQIIEADQLGVGDKVKVASIPFKVAEIDPDTGVARLEDHGENLEVAQGGQLAIDPGSLEQKKRDADFTAPTGPTGLFGQETFQAHTGIQQQMALGNENAIGNQPQASGAEAKIRKQYDPNATEKLFSESKAAQARKEFGDALDEFGRYLEGRQFTGAIFDPEIYKMAAKIVAKGINAGVKTFAEFVQNVAAKVGADRAKRLMPALREEWKKARATYADIDEPGDVDLSAVVEPSKPDIRPDLANPSQGTPGQQVVESVDAARNLAGEPQRRADVLVQELADEKLSADYTAERQKVLDTAKEGRDLSDVETVAAKRIIAKESNDALASGNEQELIDAMTFINAYRQTGTEQGRAFRQRQNFGETNEQHTERLLQEAILTPPEKSTPQQWATQIPAIKEELKAIGVDVADLATTAKNPVLAAQALGKINAIKSPRSDKFFEYWRNAILSGPKTQAANILGNAGNTVWDMTAQRFVEASINTFARRKDDATFGEFKHMLRGVLPGISRGAQNFLSAWKSEVPSFDVQMGRQSGTEITPNISIKGKAGRFIRVPQRALLAVDEFAKSMIWEMQVAAHAYRIAKSEGLSGNALAKRIQDLSMDTESLASQRAYDDALRLTFQERTGKLLQYALAARKDVPALRYLMPFVTTPVNILKTGLRKSPLGSLPLAAKIIKAAQTGDYSGITPRIAEQVLAWAVMAAFLGNDPDDPWITGAASELDKRTRDFSRRQGTPPPQSIRIGDTWVSYARIEPAATAISMMVDIVDAWKKGGAGGVATKPLESVLGQLDSKTFLRGMGDLISAVRDRNLESVAQWGSNFATSWVPNLVRSGARSLRDEVPERSVWGRGEDWRERFAKRLVQKTETGVIPDQTKYDVWGRPLEYGKGPVPGTDWLYRMLVPLDLKIKEPFAGDVALLNWNNAHEDEDWFPSTPQKYTTKGGKQTYMSDEQYAEYSRVAGENARRKVQAYFDGPPDPHNPTANDIKVMKKLMTAAREEARDKVLR